MIRHALRRIRFAGGLRDVPPGIFTKPSKPFFISQFRSLTMNRRATRREFLKQTTIAGAGLWAAQNVFDRSQPGTAEAKGLIVNRAAALPIVDTHQHLWD